MFVGEEYMNIVHITYMRPLDPHRFHLSSALNQLITLLLGAFLCTLYIILVSDSKNSSI